jgi:hypothetical protein
MRQLASPVNAFGHASVNAAVLDGPLTAGCGTQPVQPITDGHESAQWSATL